MQTAADTLNQSLEQAGRVADYMELGELLCRDALTRLETMMLMAGFGLPERALREQIASALDVVIQLARLSDGTRKLVELGEITGMEGNMITTQTIFSFDQIDVSDDGKVIGDFHAGGVMPNFLKRLERYGFKIPRQHFLPDGPQLTKKAS